MYFEDVKKFDIEKNVSGLDELYAHLKKDGREKLKAHIDLVYSYFLKLCAEKNLDDVFLRLERSFFRPSDKVAIGLWKELIVNTIYMHDVGKVNEQFQLFKMKNEKFKHIDTLTVDSKHSMLSACIYFDYYLERVKGIEKSSSSTIILVLTLNSYIISKHHGTLENFAEFKEKFLDAFSDYKEKAALYRSYKGELKEKSDGFFEKIYNNIEKAIVDIEKYEKWKSIEVYIYSKLLFSLLTASDFYATSNYSTGKKIDHMGTIKDINKYYSIYKNSKIYEKIQLYKEALKGNGESPFGKNDINRLRTEMFLEAEENLEKAINERIFYLEAPTGAGKTNTSINLAFKLLERCKSLNKIFYIFPFNTLVEQTKNSLDDIFENNNEIKREIAVINSITPIMTEDEEEDNKEICNKKLNKKVDYDKSLLDRQFFHYPIVLTTHVNLFTHLFGNSREAVFLIAHLANSIIILDEIQSYRNNLWKEIIIFLKKYAEVLNIKIIIMSATLPRLDKLTDSDKGFVQLIKNRSNYFENPLFKNRVKLDFSLLNEEAPIEKINEKVIAISKNSNKNILIEFINKKTSMNFFKALLELNKSENLKRKLLLITGDDNKAERNKIIKQVKTEKNIILVATQVIEAGVDIDMDIGFKDMSILDAEEQFLGRINRSCKKEDCTVYFFNLDKATYVYKRDYRKEEDITLISKEIRNVLINKNFSKFYDLVMEKIEKGLNKENDMNIDEFRKEMIFKLDFKGIEKRMQLIEDEDKEYQIFLSRDIGLENGEILNGHEVWEEYVELLKDNKLGYAEKKVKLSIVNEKMNYFIYKVKHLSISYNDFAGNIYWIKNGENYFTEGKFDRDKLNKSETIGCDIL
jgi:CRISPR-associated endonuclease/helicase Cas3